MGKISRTNSHWWRKNSKFAWAAPTAVQIQDNMPNCVRSSWVSCEVQILDWTIYTQTSTASKADTCAQRRELYRCKGYMKASNSAPKTTIALWARRQRQPAVCWLTESMLAVLFDIRMLHQHWNDTQNSIKAVSMTKIQARPYMSWNQNVLIIFDRRNNGTTHRNVNK